MNEIKLGDKVKSKVSGFTGTVTAKCEYLHSETRYLVTANELTDGEEKTKWFAAEELDSENEPLVTKACASLTARTGANNN